MKTAIKAKRGVKFTGKLVAWCVLFSSLVSLIPASADACTLWAATGARVRDQGTLIAKNRDNTRDLVTELRFVRREKGFCFIGLFDPEADGYVVSGINEKGLTVVNASAASVPEAKRNVAKEDLTERILTSFDSVDSATEDTALFVNSHPAFYMIADAAKIASVEVAPGGKVSINVLNDGAFVHTNHYMDKTLLFANEHKTPGSAKRLDRIYRLINARALPFTLDQFVLFSKDRGEGLNDGIWKTCSTSKKVCTLATWVAYIPKQGFPELYIRFARHKEPESALKLTLDAVFWTEGLKEKSIP
ncbi:MAG: hypothetical protein C0392_11250 [Syntrophus sp. (in: bacteria)]|nr:hypothetical protein [Syntrophus sp. (in: bacteria)]